MSSFNRYGAAPSMELALYPDNANTLDEIFSVIKLRRNKLHVRLIGRSSDLTNKELANYYLGKFHHWKGDLKKETHLIKPLFVDALKETTLFRKLEQKLNERGYQIINVSFEKLIFNSNSISVPDVYLTCEKRA